MQAVQRMMDGILQQLRGLSAQSRLLVGSLTIILVMSLFIVALYTGRASMVPLPVQEGAARTSAMEYLSARNIDWTERGGEILVPAEQRHVLLAQMTDAQIIGPDQIDFGALVREDSPFLSKAQNDRRWLIATMNHLSRTISRMHGITRADVVIDEPARPSGLGRAHLSPSASVNILTTGSELTQEQVNAIAEMVAGAHAELKVGDVAVVDANAGRVYRATGDNARRAGRYLELQQSTTDVYQEKLLQALQYIPGVNVAVNVIVDHREIVEESRRVDDPKQGVTREASRSLNATNRRSGGEPGVRSNTGASIAMAGQPVSTMEDERSETRMIPAFGGTDSRTHDPGGHALKVNASIGVPRSYFIRLFGDHTGRPGVQPPAEELDPFIQQEIGRIREHVQPLIDTGPKGGRVQGTVAVTMIPDFAAPGVGADPGPGSGANASGFLTESLVKYGSLGTLALVSLAMMFMMVRRASVRQPLPSEEELLGMPPALAGAGPLVSGEAGPAPLPLEGVEVDEATVRRQEILDQLNEMSRTAPQDAAELLRRWLH
ncbi:MAG: hypothetical protein ACYTGC_09965 [Planctomycetota bacterium]|jgi:flagellar M-ring protein FliF